MEKMEKAMVEVISEVVNEVIEYKRHVTDALLGVLYEVHEGGKGSLEAEVYGKRAMQLQSRPQQLYRALKAIMRMQVDIADVSSRKSFLAAFLTISKLEDNLRRLSGELESRVGVDVVNEEALVIHSTWSKLAEAGLCLLCRPVYTDFDVESICEALKDVGEGLSKGELLKEVRDDVASYPRRRERPRRLSQKTHGLLLSSASALDERLKRLLCEYVVDHLCTLGEQLAELKGDIDNKDVETYLNKVFVERAFLEYEVYSALIRQGIAAIPRLQFSIRDHEYRREVLAQEVDVVAVADDELWLIEVTSRKGEVEEKLERYDDLKEQIGADKVVFVCSPPLRKSIEEAIQSTSREEGFYCVEFDKLYSEISKLATLRSRR